MSIKELEAELERRLAEPFCPPVDSRVSPLLENWMAAPPAPAEVGNYHTSKSIDWTNRARAAWLLKLADFVDDWQPPDVSFTMEPYKGREVIVSMLNSKMYEPGTHEPILDPDGNHLVWSGT